MTKHCLKHFFFRLEWLQELLILDILTHHRCHRFADVALHHQPSTQSARSRCASEKNYLCLDLDRLSKIHQQQGLHESLHRTILLGCRVETPLLYHQPEFLMDWEIEFYQTVLYFAFQQVQPPFVGPVFLVVGNLSIPKVSRHGLSPRLVVLFIFPDHVLN